MTTHTSSHLSLARVIGDFVSRRYQNPRATRLVFHSYQLAEQTAHEVEALAAAEDTVVTQLDKILILAWLLPAGYLEDYRDPVAGTQTLLEAFMQEHQQKVPKGYVETLTQFHQSDGTAPLENQLLHDAWNWVRYGESFVEKSPLRKLELELVGGQVFSKSEWSQLELSALLKIRFLRPFSQGQYMPAIQQNILAQRQIVEKSKFDFRVNRLADDEQTLFQQLERKIPTSGVQTFFRTNYRNHINLSAIADQKAHIMISVNAILLSVIISILSYRNIPETTPMILLPTVIFIVTGLLSLTFAVLAARPKVTKKSNDPSELQPKDLVFFGNFSQLSLEDYEVKMDELFKNGAHLYQALIRDLYYLGKVLDQKYRYLTISYNLFMGGFIATALCFLLTLLVG